MLGGGRPKITVGGQDRTAVTPDQYKAIGQGTVAQFGTWSVNEADKTLTYHVENSFFGNQGREFKLSVSLNGDELKLVASSGNNDPRDLGSAATWKKSPPPPQTLRQQLVGTWNLVSCDWKAADGTTEPECVNPRGSLSFDASGRYTAVVAPSGRPQASAGRNSPAEEIKAAAQGFRAGFGTWSVNDADKIITRHREGTLLPNVEGTDTKDMATIVGDELRLVDADPNPRPGVEIWRRAK
jgi:hypothetical protein